VTRRITGFPDVGSDGTPAGPDIAVGKAGVWATDGRDELFRLDASLAERVQLGGFGGDAGIEAVAVGADAVWAAGAGVAWHVRARPARPSRTYPVGAGPAGIVLGAGSVWSANAYDGTVSRIDMSSGQTTTIPVGGTPNDLSFASGLIWVTVD
jgi:streptogramin lyase